MGYNPFTFVDIIPLQVLVFHHLFITIISLICMPMLPLKRVLKKAN